MKIYLVTNECDGRSAYMNKETAFEAFAAACEAYRADFLETFEDDSFMMDDYEVHPFDKDTAHRFFNRDGYTSYIMWAMDDGAYIGIETLTIEDCDEG